TITLRRDHNGVAKLARGYVGLVFGVAGLALWLITVHDAVFANMSGYGLVSVLGWTYFAGLTLVVVGFAIEVLRTPLRSSRLIFLIMLLALFLFGSASAIEPVAELTDAYVHAGFIQYIIGHGHPLNGYDARFSWPGGFSMAAILVAFAGKTNALGFLRWFPLVIEWSYLAPLLVIARFSGVSRRAGWLGIAIYYATNWILQDYFSPQGLNFFFFLVVIAAVLACWRPKPVKTDAAKREPWHERYVQSRAVLTRVRILGHDSMTTWGSAETLSVLGLVGLVCLASSMSHQLTPYALIVSLGACLVARRLGRPELVLLVVVLAIGWLSLGASNYWVGHLNAIFGGFFQLGSTINQNVTSRVSGASSHLSVVYIRLLLTAGVFLLAGVGFLRRNTDSRVLEALVGAPFLLLAAQSYGGEGLMRVVLFGLPFTGLLAASAIFPRQAGHIHSLLPKFVLGRTARTRRMLLGLLVVVVVLGFALATTIVRGGNDAYESFSRGELSAVNYVYDHVRPGEMVGAPNYYLPYGQRDVGEVIDYLPTAIKYKKIGRQLLNARPNFIILSQSEEAYGQDVAGYPPGWEESLEATFLNNHYKIVASWTTATVLESTLSS
ncbi:MAG: hypothetical protein WBD82_02130, partial [Acidimicrobiales bacterium]